MSSANEILFEVNSFVFQNFGILTSFLGAVDNFFSSVILTVLVFSVLGIGRVYLLLDFWRRLAS